MTLLKEFTAIPNELLIAFAKTNLSPYEWRIVFCIIRNSYGWNKTEAKLKIKQIASLTGLDRRLIPRVINRLISKKVIIRNGNTYKIQEDYHQWESLATENVITRDDKNSTVSDREKIITKLKEYFPSLTIPSLTALNNVSTEKLDYFLWKIESRREIDTKKIINPLAYVKSLTITEEFPFFADREKAKEQRRKIEEEERKKRDKEWEDMTPEEIERNRKKVREIIESLTKTHNQPYKQKEMTKCHQ